MTIIACLCAGSSVGLAAADKEPSFTLYYSQWTKACIEASDKDLGGCMTAMEARGEAGKFAVAAIFATRAGKPVLRIRLPLGSQLVHGTRIIVDANPPRQAPYIGCTQDGCLSEYELTPELRAELQQGQKLITQSINASGAPVTAPLPLNGRDDAANGPPKSLSAIGQSQDDVKDKQPTRSFLADPRPFLWPASTGTGSSFSPSLTYVKWTKFCLKGQEANAKQVCFTGKDGRIENGQPVIAAVLIEPEGESKKILRLTFPLAMQASYGTRIAIDDGAPQQKPFVICFPNGCMSDYEATPELISNLKTGRSLDVQATNGNGSLLKFSMAVARAEFAKANEGPPTDAKSFEANQKKLQAELQQRAKPAEQSKGSLVRDLPWSSGNSAAEAPSATKPSTSTALLRPQGRRVALVIGNSLYQNVPQLPNPSGDAAAVGAALRAVGFQSVTVLNDLSRDGTLNALRSFASEAANADWAVIYYAGHGMEAAGVNYLIPVDAALKSDRDLSIEAISLEQVLNAAERASGLRLVILDACRDNPFASQMKRALTVASRSVSRGLASVEPDAGTLVVYAAKHGETASDGDGVNSPFATAFMSNLRKPNLEIRRLFDYVRDDVMDVTKRQQQPFTYGSLPGRQEYFFVATK
ncbi:invasion associated locus B family protein [Bradyrhizobium sp. 1]|uniref:invasion associated locus B family protein n=1 Tax=Bradyrhizobium sp. 1 TaxID=241591 RepID=UPI001FFB88BB|nr:invasion associated locus B family protein [Bradyrhizobium sp. 1]MCK1396462.1 invasion associated locus B family protein [Bradyrhizobium sp. 1]